MIDYRQEPTLRLRSSALPARKRYLLRQYRRHHRRRGNSIKFAVSNGRVIQCGTAANASWSPTPTGPRQEREILTRRLRWSGFIIFDHIAEFPAAAADLTQLAARKEIVFDEEILIGLDQAPLALARLYQGANRGKLIVSLLG